METNNEEKVVKTEGYTYKLISVVPLKHALIRKNIFTGSVDWVGQGLHFNPISTNKLVNLADRTIDYASKAYKVKEGFDVTVDPAVTFRVTDPVKFEFASEDPVAVLKIKLESLLRKLCAKYSYDQLVQIAIKLNSPEFADIKAELKPLEDKYGLSVSDLILKSVEQSQALKDDYEKSAAQARENERKISQAEADAKVAEAKARELATLNKVEETRIVNLVKALVAQGVDQKAAMEIVLYGSGNVDLRRISFEGLDSKNGSAVRNGAMLRTGMDSVEGHSRTKVRKATTE